MTLLKNTVIYLVSFVLVSDSISMQNNPKKRPGDDFTIDQQSKMKKQKITDEEAMGTDFLEENKSEIKSHDTSMEEEGDIPYISKDTTETSIEIEELSPQVIEKRADEFLDALYIENKDLEEDERNDIKEGILTGILNLDDRDLGSIPKEIGNLTHLYEVNIAENHISALPPEFEKLKNLKDLGIGGNQFVEFPKPIRSLTKLTALNVNSNKIIDIPHEIGNLVHLERLDLRKNKISNLPVELWSLKKLTELDLANNNLTMIPPEIGNLVQLERLSVRKNNIKQLPNTIGDLKFSIKFPEKNYKIDLNNNPLDFEGKNQTSWGWYDLHKRFGDKFVFTTSPLYERYYLTLEYINNISNYSEMIYLDTSEKSDVVEPVKYGMYKHVLFNQNGYEHENDKNDEKITETCQKGDPFILKEKIKNEYGQEVDVDVPIGYNIYIPEGDVKAILVFVYGGGTKSIFDEIRFKLGALGQFEYYLLGQGIAIVTLNTFDLLQSENQLKQPHDVHQIVQKSIHSFYNILKYGYSPLCRSNRNLCKDLESLKGKKIFLFGSSFGGRTALVQAENYPSTFDGYISHDGMLSLKMDAQADIPSLNRQSAFDVATKTHPWLTPMTEEIGKSESKITLIKRPILLLHNIDDNNVNIKVTEAWYKKAREVINNRKQHPLKDDMFDVRLHITHEGNPIVPDKGFHNKGHFIPTDPGSFKQYAETVNSFILNGPNKIMEFSDWAADRTGVISDKFYRAANYIDQFVSEAYPIYKSLISNKLQQHSKQKRVIGTPEDFMILDAQRAAIKTRNELDIEDIHRALEEGRSLEDIEALTSLSPSQAFDAYKPFDTYERRKMELSTQKAIESEVRKEVKRDWKEHYQRLYKIFALLNLYKNNIHEAIRPIRAPNVISYSNVHLVLERQLPKFFKFLAEKYPEKPIAKYLNIVGGVQTLSRSTAMVYSFIQILINRTTSNDLKSYLLKTFLIANPQFMDLYQINDLAGEKNAQEALIKVIVANVENARKAFQGTVREAMNLDK